MLIDRFLPTYQTSARYQVELKAPIERAYTAARCMDMGESWIVRGLYRLRGLPSSSLTLDGMLRWGFVLLADVPNEEIVFGLIGRFWTLSGDIQAVSPTDFIDFQRPGYAKVAGNLAFSSVSSGLVRVSTETRVHCLDAASQRSFRLYWSLIGPFSGLIRREWLRLIERESSSAGL